MPAGLERLRAITKDLREPISMPSPRPVRRVLIVDDEPDLRLLVLTFLKERGIECVEAETIESALHLLRTDNRFDLLLTDMIFPDGGSGWGFLADVHESKLVDAPAIVISGMDLPAEAVEVIHMLAYRYIRKGVGLFWALGETIDEIEGKRAPSSVPVSPSVLAVRAQGLEQKS